ncbi:hypothetical protein [Actinoplanes sp. NPDC051494]|uniref:hypothetical protein n=1 Tax=Actinoplanes sp. NPDC051494 TaxID=3363907 RepID=UPI0037B7AC7E
MNTEVSPQPPERRIPTADRDRAAARLRTALAQAVIGHHTVGIEGVAGQPAGQPADQ